MSTSNRPSTRRAVALGSVVALVTAGAAFTIAVRPLAVGRLPL